ncbi:MAG: response regulator [Proteobacteria bacterium]|nr:response regulator [Pseudomonadota bacterium]
MRSHEGSRQAVRPTEAQSRLIAECSDDGVCILGADRRISFANAQLGEMLNTDAALLQGLLFGDLLRSDQPGWTGGDWDSFDADLRLPTQDLLFDRADRSPIRLRISGRAFGQVGRPIGAVLRIATPFDVTVAASHEDFHRSQRLESIGKLTGGIAHDFNNLLTVVIGAAETMVEETTGDPELRALAELVRVAGERGSELTSQLLSFARRQPLEPRSIDIDELIAAMSPLLKRTLGEQLEVQVITTPTAWRVMADPAQVESAILNLAINARDAMPQGGRLTVETQNITLDTSYAHQQSEVAAGDYVLVAVSDTGEGMAPYVVEHAFEPFFTTKAPGEGSGLGLSMVYGFVKQSNGHVAIYSEPGLGTTVKLYLPRAEPEAARLVRHVAESELPRGSECILAVEDDPLVREHVVRQLEGLGYTVIPAADGPEALRRLAEAGRVELLFTDIVMPHGMDGRRLAEAVKDQRPGVKVLYTSGYTENVVVHHGRLDAGVHLLSKPYRKRALAQKVREVLDATDDGARPSE